MARVWPRFAGGSALVLWLAGCATTQPAAEWHPTGDPLADGQQAMAKGPVKDRLLWADRTAAVALRRGDYATAKQLLDDVLLSLGGIAANDKSARQARGYFHAESKKTFRGEPYERVMAYYYRGILYWMDGQLDNARACFRSAELEDSDAADQTYASDYVLLDYLDGFATAKLGGDGSDQFKRAEQEARLAKPWRYDTSANVLVFAEYGNGPTKYATGQYGEQLRIAPGVSPAHGAILKVQGQTVPLNPYDDLNFQASTRGGRVMDHILGNKAVFKSATDEVGNAALVSGAVLASTQRGGAQDVGLGLAAAGLISKLVSAVTTPAADTRCWDNLPQYLGFGALHLPAGQYQGSVEFLDSAKVPISRLAKNITFSVTDTNRDTVVFVSEKNQ